jgi:hypothetical protein
MIAASFVSLFEVHLLHQNLIILKSEKKKDKTKKSFNFSNCPPFYLQSTGTFFATARYGSATPVPPSVVSRGAGWLVCLCDISFTYCVSFLHFRPKIYCFITWEICLIFRE